MSRILITNFILTLFLSTIASAQNVDSTLGNLQKISSKYTNGIDKKINQYSYRVTSKTEKTLTKLSRWENKIHSLLQKVNPEEANRLFGNNQLTFTSLLQKVKQGEAIGLQYQAPYNKYRDDITTSLKYIAQQKAQLDNSLIKKIKITSGKMKELVKEEDESEAIQQFIKERKKQLIEQCFQYIGKSRYLSKINKEAYYYTETLKNYKEIFADSKKAEEKIKGILRRTSMFQKFIERNSQLASLFGQPDGGQFPSGATGLSSMPGLQTRASIQSLIQGRITSGGPDALQQIRQNIQAGQMELTKLKDKLLNSTSGTQDGGEMPNFKPNMQKTRTFLQRVEIAANLQTTKTSEYLPVTSDIGLSIGYKINDKSMLGVGAALKLGWGSGFNNIRISYRGIGLRSYIDYKLKGNFYMSGGYEQNYNSSFNNIQQLKHFPSWQQAALLGISKKIQLKGRKAKFQLLYDFFNYRNRLITQPFIYRIEYNLK